MFPSVIGSCGYALPETTADPVDFLRFRTYNGDSFGPPNVNFLTLEPGIAVQTRLWILICTVNEHNFLLNYDEPDPAGHVSGLVWVEAFDDDNENGLDRWEIYPDPGVAKIRQDPSLSHQNEWCEYGEHLMPFRLTLERIVE